MWKQCEGGQCFRDATHGGNGARRRDALLASGLFWTEDGRCQVNGVCNVSLLVSAVGFDIRLVSLAERPRGDSSGLGTGMLMRSLFAGYPNELRWLSWWTTLAILMSMLFILINYIEYRNRSPSLS